MHTDHSVAPECIHASLPASCSLECSGSDLIFISWWEAALHCFYIVSELNISMTPVFWIQRQRSVLPKKKSVCSPPKSGAHRIFTLKLEWPSVSHIPTESRCQTLSCALPPSVCCCGCLSSPVIIQTSTSWLIYPLSCESWGLFFESGWEIKILISSAGLLCCLQGRIYRLWESTIM